MAVSTRRILHGAITNNMNREDVSPFSHEFIDDSGGRLGHDRRQDTRDTDRPSLVLNSQLASTAVLGRLSDQGSILSKFLLATNERGDGDERKSCWSRLKACFARPGSMDSMDAYCCALMLDPMESRSVRVIMLGEAYALFGALFLSCTWILYEYGSVKAYGDAEEDIIDDVFETVMALAIMCNIFLALNGMSLWVLSILHSESNQQWVFTVRGMLSLCNTLCIVTIFLDHVGMILAVYSNLSPRWPETIICFAVAAVLYISWQQAAGEILMKAIPLEFYHTPLWNQLVSNPAAVLTKKGRQELQTGARARAEELKQRAYQRRGIFDQNQTRRGADGDAEGQYPYLSIGALLRGAASRLGKSEHDVTSYEARLAEDWIEEVSQLRGMSVDFLARYMPWALANEVHMSLMGRGRGDT
ncbi:hypothetical protein THAOC_22337 [Thalassiosira oceanica]|uniref:Uncharacterized protein n=1 Tax=Thalassiosira oceanica TaxID=159749 RepID=K0RUT0_THAOC|nr:hypothetical protein THAOC_22337 [Thalassiosira oceanica]|eukprot:EJK57603.1 hypothetical protein THAOC_22337 [Thalassiosira oceanica]